MKVIVVEKGKARKLPEIEKPPIVSGSVSYDSDTYKTWLANMNAYEVELAKQPTFACPLEWEVGKEYEEGKDFVVKRGEQKDTTDQQQWQEMTGEERAKYFEWILVPVISEEANGQSIGEGEGWDELLSMADRVNFYRSLVADNPDSEEYKKQEQDAFAKLKSRFAIKSLP